MNIESWDRKDTFTYYKDFEDPCFNICGFVDVTGIYQESKDQNISFFLLSLYYATKAANEIENFRYRIEDEKVLIYDLIHPGSTILYDDNTFGYAYFNFDDDKSSFLVNGNKVIDDQKRYRPFVTEPSHHGFLYFSVIPWVSFISFKHARKNDGNHSIPKIVFGKFKYEDERVLMPMSVEVHHALADGYHLGQFFKRFEEYSK